MQAGLLQGGRMVRATMLGAPPLGLRVWSLFLAAISFASRLHTRLAYQLPRIIVSPAALRSLEESQNRQHE